MRLRGPWFPSREEFRRDLRAIRESVRQWVRSFAAGVSQEYRDLSPARVADRLRREIVGNPSVGKAVYALFVLAWVALIIWGRLLVPLATTPYFRFQGRFQVVAFFENGAGPEFPDSLPTFERYAGLFDVVSPFWHSVDPEGQVTDDGYREEVVGLARSRGVKVIPLVNNLKQGPGNSFDSIRTAGDRAKTVDNLARLAADRGYDGLNLGYEFLPAEAREAYSAFVTSLAQALRAQGRVLIVSVFSDVKVPPVVSGFFDYAAIGQAADFVLLLAYDLHYTATDPGPVAPLSWVEASVNSLRTYVSPSKIILGAGAHAYDWPVAAWAGIGEYLSTASALERARVEDAEVALDEASQQSFFTYVSSERIRREVWLQDGRHLTRMAALARSKGLRGLAVWRLGFSEDGALDQLAEGLRRRVER